MDIMNKPTLTVKEMQEYLGIGKTRAYQLYSRPDVDFVFRIGRKVLIDRKRLDEWKAAQMDARRESVSNQE